MEDVEDSDKKLLTVGELAAILKIGQNSVTAAIRAGKLKAFRLGERGQYRVSVAALADFLGDSSEVYVRSLGNNDS
tara:strand:+ start:157 stop:384 length:228 start_codon:yes stop_codon:yes gene_type:complete